MTKLLIIANVALLLHLALAQDTTRYAKFGRGVTGTIGAGGLLLAYNEQGKVGTVCDDEFDDNTANVVCKKLGYERFVFWTLNDMKYVKYGTKFETKGGNSFTYNSALPTLLDNFSCPSANKDCEFATEENCGHSEDVILECYEGETIQFHLSESGILLATVNTAATEVMGTVCVDSTLTESTGNFLCKQLGFDSYEESVQRTTSDLGSLPIVLDELDCPEGSTSVSQCSYHSLVHNCDHSDDIYIHCVDSKSVTFTIKENGLLVSTVRTTLGKQTGAVCDDEVNDATANFVCKTMGYNSVESYKKNNGYSRWSEKEVPIVMDNFVCPASARSMKDCDFITNKENCGRDEELVFVCAESRNLHFYQDNTVHVRITGEVSGVREGLLCGENINEHEANYICRKMGFERMAKTKEVNLENANNVVMQKLVCNTKLECTYEPLAGGCDVALRIYCFEEGIAEFQLGTEGLLMAKLQLNVLDGGVPVHGTVCDDEFNDASADVICRSMGYEGAESFKSSRSSRLAGSYPTVLDNFECPRKNLKPKDCSFHVDENCGHDEDIVLNCKGTRSVQTIQKIEFVMNYRTNERPYLKTSYTTDKGKMVSGGVCAGGLDAQQFLCASMGYQYVLELNRVNGVFSGENQAVLGGLVCPVDAHISDCKYTISIESCEYGISINCGRPGSSYRLHDTGLLVSVIESSKGNIPSPVCDDGFDDGVADIMCRSMGYSAHSSWSRNYQFYGIDCGSKCDPISTNMATTISCSDSACTYGVDEACDIGDNVVLICSGTVSQVELSLNEDGALLADVVSSVDGAQRGYVCATDIGDVENFGEGVCRILGHVELHSASIVKSQGDFVLNTLSCPGTARSIHDCSYQLLSSNNCKEIVQMSCFTQDDFGVVFKLDPTNIVLAGTLRRNERIGDDMAVCLHANFNLDTAHFICKQLGYAAAETWVGLRSSIWEKYLAGLLCPEGALSLEDCTYNTDSNVCTSGQLLSLTCSVGSGTGKPLSPSYVEVSGNTLETSVMGITDLSPTTTLSLTKNDELMLNFEGVHQFEQVDIYIKKTDNFADLDVELEVYRIVDFKAINIPCRFYSKGYSKLGANNLFGFAFRATCNSVTGVGIVIKFNFKTSPIILFDVEVIGAKVDVEDDEEIPREESVPLDDKVHTEPRTTDAPTEFPYEFEEEDLKNVIEDAVPDVFKKSDNPKTVWKPDFEEKIPYKAFKNAIEETIEKDRKDPTRQRNVMGYLYQGGYLDYVKTEQKVKAESSAEESREIPKDVVDSKDIVDTIKKFQNFNGYPETGEVSAEILDYVNKPRCETNDVHFDKEDGLCVQVIQDGKPLMDNLDLATFKKCGELNRIKGQKCMRIPSKDPAGFIQNDFPYYIEIDMKYKQGKQGKWVDLHKSFTIYYNFDRSLENDGYGDYLTVYASKTGIGYEAYQRNSEDKKVLVKFGNYEISKTQRSRREFKLRIDVEENNTAYLLINNKDVGQITYEWPLKSSALIRWLELRPILITARLCKRPESYAAKRIKKRFTVSVNKWDTNTVTYNFQNYSTILKSSDTRIEIERALHTLSVDNGLTFKEVEPNKDAMLSFMFIRGKHSDPLTFYGPMAEKAHAFSPLHSEIHFNDYENFSRSKSDNGISLYYVTLHECGHALGIAHSEYTDAIMHSTYPNNAFDKEDLHRDDLRAYNTVYPGKESREGSVANMDAETVATLQELWGKHYRPKLPHPKECVNQIDAAFMFNSRIYLISNTFIWEYEDHKDGLIKIGNRKRVSDVLKYWNSRVYAAFTVGNRVYVIGDKVVYRYKQYMKGRSIFWAEATGLIDTMFNIPATDKIGRVSAAFTLGNKGTYQTTLVISAQEYYQINWKNPKKVNTINHVKDDSGTKLLGKKFFVREEFDAAFPFVRYFKKTGKSSVELWRFGGKEFHYVVPYPDKVRKINPWAYIPEAFLIEEWCDK